MSVNDKLNRIKEIKGNIKDAIVEKGVEVTDSDSFNSYADKIRAISGGSEIIQEPWVKPEGWPDIKEGMQENEVRMLVYDKVGMGEFGIVIEGTECTIDWGDGSEPETRAYSASYNRASHTFNTENSIKYVDEHGLTHNMYMIKIYDCNSISKIECTSTSYINKNDENNMLLWYVDSFTHGKEISVSLSSRNLQCAEFTGDSIVFCTLSNCTNLKHFKCSGTFKCKSGYVSYFSDCCSLKSLDVSNWDTSDLTSMYGMFNNCHSLKSLDVSNWDVSKVTNMQFAFNNCYSLKSLDVSNWDVSKVTNMYGVFNNCCSLKSLDVSNWDTSSVTSMYCMFYSCYSLESLDTSRWDVSKVTEIGSIFYNCAALSDLGERDWDFSLFTANNCRTVFSGNKMLKRISIIYPVNEDVGTYSRPFYNSSENCAELESFSLTIPRPTCAYKTEIGYSIRPACNLQRIIVKGQDGMAFTASSPQIVLDHTKGLKEEQINEFFTNLPTVTNSPTISLKYTPHAGYANMGIALEKGWNVLYNSSTNSTSTIPLGDEENAPILPLVYRFIPEEDGTFVDANGNKCNLLYSQSVATMNPTGWEMLPTFEDALNKYGIEVEEEYREEIAKDVLAYANDDSLIKRYNIELD